MVLPMKSGIYQIINDVFPKVFAREVLGDNHNN